jgi:hypothetical protein
LNTRSIGPDFLFLDEVEIILKETPMGQLALTFRGPFVFAVRTSSIDVYAPKCPGHRAGISTVNDEQPICGRFKNGGSYVYTLSLFGVNSNLGAISFANPGWVVDAPTGSSVDPSKASFCVNVPRPNQVYAINPATTEVVTGSTPKGQIAQHGTGMRFYYDNVDLSKVAVSLINPEADPPIPLSISNLPSLPNYADVDIGYADPDADDADHADAMSCFDNTMQLLGLSWWLYYGQSDKGMLARTGSDCQSLAVVLGR